MSEEGGFSFTFPDSHPNRRPREMWRHSSQTLCSLRPCMRIAEDLAPGSQFSLPVLTV